MNLGAKSNRLSVVGLPRRIPRLRMRVNLRCNDSVFWISGATKEESFTPPRVRSLSRGGGIEFNSPGLAWHSQPRDSSVQAYPGFSVRASHDYDLDGDGKENLSVRLTPEQGSSNKGAIIHYRPSGDTTFSELVRFEASQPGNNLYTASYTNELFPTQVDHGITGKNLIFRESWQERDQKKNNRDR